MIVWGGFVGSRAEARLQAEAQCHGAFADGGGEFSEWIEWFAVRLGLGRPFEGYNVGQVLAGFWCFPACMTSAEAVLGGRLVAPVSNCAEVEARTMGHAMAGMVPSRYGWRDWEGGDASVFCDEAGD